MSFLRLLLCVETSLHRPGMTPTQRQGPVDIFVVCPDSSSYPDRTTAVALQLALHDTWNSAMSAGCGVIVGLLYWSLLSPLQRFRVPGQWLFQIFGAAFPGGDQIEARRANMTRIQRVRAFRDAIEHLSRPRGLPPRSSAFSQIRSEIVQTLPTVCSPRYVAGAS